MPKFDWSNTQAASGGGVFTIPNDGYVCVITAAEWGTSTNGQPRLKLTWDVAEGPYAGVCANNGWYDSKHSDYISFSPSALRFAKQKLEAIAKSNPGFDPFAAIDNDQFQAFVNRLVGLTLKLEYGEWQGRQTKKMVVDAYKTVADIRSGNFSKPVTEEPEQVPQTHVASVPPTFGQTFGSQIAAARNEPAPF